MCECVECLLLSTSSAERERICSSCVSAYEHYNSLARKQFVIKKVDETQWNFIHQKENSFCSSDDPQRVLSLDFKMSVHRYFHPWTSSIRQASTHMWKQNCCIIKDFHSPWSWIFITFLLLFFQFLLSVQAQQQIRKRQNKWKKVYKNLNSFERHFSIIWTTTFRLWQKH